jgi:hypothetical protein
MPDPLYTRLLATANRLLAKYGKPGQIVTDGAPTGPPHNPQPGAPVFTSCVWVEAENSISNRPSTTVQQGDVFGYIAASAPVAPTMARRIEVSAGVELNFVELLPLDPGGVLLLHEFRARA